MRELDFEDYQKKLENQEKHLQLLVWSKKENKTYLYKPKMASIYGTQLQKQTYYKKLRNKLKLDPDTTREKISFITLTYDTKLYSAVEVIKRCKRDIQLFLKLIRNRIGKLQYMWIAELTKQNYIHFHIISNQYIPAKIIRSCWTKTTGSIITHVKGATRAQAGRYITKYVSEAAKLSENQAKFLYDNNFKRLYAHSRDFFKKMEKKRGMFFLLGIITSPFCVIQADRGEFIEVSDIALAHILNLMEQGDWGYLKRF